MKSHYPPVVRLLLTLLIASAPVPSLAGGPEDIAMEFVQAWNSHDKGQFARLFIANAYWVPGVGIRLDGREAIVNDLGLAHSTWAKATTMKASDVVVRQLRPDSAVVLFNVPFLDNDGKPVEPANALLIVTVKESEGWRIAVGQLTKPGKTNMPSP
jgi:uncharacterized protein (TIGR02246 family)